MNVEQNENILQKQKGAFRRLEDAKRETHSQLVESINLPRRKTGVLFEEGFITGHKDSPSLESSLEYCVFDSGRGYP